MRLSEATDQGLASCRTDFPALARKYGGRSIACLDGPAGTQVPRQVIEAIADYYRQRNSNTEGHFVTSRESDAMLARTREDLAAFLNAPSGAEISFGANMTTLAYSLAHALEKVFEPGDEVIITQLDHEANRGPWLGLQRSGVVVREARLKPTGVLDYEHFESLVGERTRLIAVGMASNALGTVNDVGRIGAWARASGSLLLLDAVHFAPHFPIDVQDLDADFLLCSAYKFYGPHVGILYTRRGLLNTLPTDRLRTQKVTGPARIETGTLNHAAIAGTQAAVHYLAGLGEGASLRERLASAMQGLAAYEYRLADHLIDCLQGLPGIELWGLPALESERTPTVSVTIDGYTAAEVCTRLGDQGVQVWDGHFYAIRPVEVLGLLERGGLVRIGLSMYNTEDEVRRVVGGIADLVGV